MRTKARQKRHWIDRTKRYIGGALMILAPLGVGACSSKSDKDAVPQTDAEVQDILHREMIAIAPLDMFKVDGEEGNIPPEAIAIAPFDGLEPDKAPEVIAIAPVDVVKPDAQPEMIAIAPVDLVKPDAQPEVIAIAPIDTTKPDVQPEVIAIAPVDVGQDTGPDYCAEEGTWCTADLMCQAQAICIIPTPCCGGCECQPVPCNPGQSTCPDGSACVVDGLGDKGHCKQIPSTAPGGFYAQCSEDKDCLQEYFCQQTMFCIAPANGNDEPPPACNQNNCVPVPCDAQGKCPTASDCTPYGHPNAEQAVKTCVRDLGQVPGGYAGGCNKQEPACNSNQYFCQDLCYPAMCIIPVEGCIPIVCSPDKPGDCPKDAECKDVGVTTACVKK